MCLGKFVNSTLSQSTHLQVPGYIDSGGYFLPSNLRAVIAQRRWIWHRDVEMVFD